ncbi:MAG: secretin N-terminal domain-containing protein, partial [Planctomycetota bacterium]
MHFSARNLILALAGSLAMAMAAALAADATPDAKEILALSGVRYGLCVHLGCGRAESPGLTAALAENSTLVVHGLAGDEAALARARKEIEARNVCGRAMVERIPLNPLPYLSDMANLAVVEDLAALGISKEEILRIVAPNGVLCIREAGKWAKTVKPRPKEMDDWSHPFHGADGNMVSADKLIKFPLGFRWIDGLPVNINAWAACRAWIVAGGRVYTLSSNELENLENHSKKHFLSARDAFSGIPLWKMNVETTDDGAHLTWRNTGALVADEQRVYAVQSTKPIVVEGATGKLIATCDTKYTPHRLAVLNGVLLAACWEAHHSANDAVEGASLWATWLPTMDAETKSTRGTIEAFEAASGKPKWSAPLAAYMLLAADDTVYALTHSGVSKSDSDFEKELASAVEKELQQELANPPAKEQPAEPAKELAAEPAKEPAKELAALPATEPAKDQRLENKMFRLVNIPPDGPKNSECWASLVEELKKAKSPIGTISFEKRSNTIAARDTPEALEKIEQAVKKVDIPPQQALAKELAKKLAQDYGKDSGKDAAKEQPWKNAWKKLTEARRTQLRAAGRNEWERQVVALDLQTGQEKWRLHHGKLGSRADLELGCAGPGYLVVYKRDERGFSVLSAKDGSVLWQTKGGGTWTPVVDGLLWQGRKRFDPLTGAVKGDWPVDPGDQGCTPSNVVDNIVTRTRGCGYEQVVQEEGKPPRTQGVQYTGARGGLRPQRGR